MIPRRKSIEARVASRLLRRVERDLGLRAWRPERFAVVRVDSHHGVDGARIVVELAPTS